MAVAPAMAAAGGASPWLAGAQIFGGLAGVAGNKSSRRKADAYREAAARLLQLRGAGTEEALRQAYSYNPAKEDQAAIDYASGQAGRSFKNAYRELGAEFRRGGGDTTGDTRWANQVAAAGAASWDPLKEIAAQMASTRTVRKIGALMQAVNSGGDITGQYGAMAEDQDRQAGNIGDSLGLIVGGMNGLKGGSRAPQAPAQPRRARRPQRSDQADGDAMPARIDPFGKWKPRTVTAVSY